MSLIEPIRLYEIKNCKGSVEQLDFGIKNITGNVTVKDKWWMELEPLHLWSFSRDYCSMFQNCYVIIILKSSIARLVL